MSVSFDAVICHRGLAWWYYECTWYMSCNQYGIVCSCFGESVWRVWSEKLHLLSVIMYGRMFVYNTLWYTRYVTEQFRYLLHAITPFHQHSTATTCAVFADFTIFIFVCHGSGYSAVGLCLPLDHLSIYFIFDSIISIHFVLSNVFWF